ncbi:hypothetical protein tinsulaeT_20970 [Thalassotalea insulae]|uniref:DM13 domain-containing protein n=1 Tax=Thalassotalea insulae TaxID=2056778 RepID=A0ABQ6GTS4_9GAMM|nr:DM13 domain-containing protein [Thalassotalea insulae]GLX78757.1 hypothetical protein tinsulaeT_20970 [Thalassotalea insulae]
MKINYLITSLFSLLIISCGGGGGGGSSSTPTPLTNTTPTTFTGMFLDSAVQGLNYATASGNGMTNAEGEFSYQANETVTFSIGDISFSAVLVKNVMTPLDIVGTSDINHPEVVNILRLLQTLDFDGDPNNGIQITAAAHSAAQGMYIDFAAPDFDEQVIDLVFDNGGFHQMLISAEMAVYHFQQTLAELNDQGISNCDKTHPMVGYYGYFETFAHNVSGRAEIMDDCTIKVTEFSYDGGGPEVYFYAAIDHQYSEAEAFPISQAINGMPFNNDEMILRLPNGKTLDDLNGISVWCVDFNANFGQVTFTPE